MMAVKTLDSTAGTLLQYLEAVADIQEAHEDPLILAVVRALGRCAALCSADYLFNECLINAYKELPFLWLLVLACC